MVKSQSVTRDVIVAIATGLDTMDVAAALAISPKLVQEIVDSPLARAEIARLRVSNQ